MMRVLLSTAVCLAVAAPAGATAQLPSGSFRVAQSPTATGGASGGPDQRQYVPEGATGGRSGGPDQRKAKRSVKKTRKAKKPQ